MVIVNISRIALLPYDIYHRILSYLHEDLYTVIPTSVEHRKQYRKYVKRKAKYKRHELLEFLDYYKYYEIEANTWINLQYAIRFNAKKSFNWLIEIDCELHKDLWLETMDDCHRFKLFDAGCPLNNNETMLDSYFDALVKDKEYQKIVNILEYYKPTVNMFVSVCDNFKLLNYMVKKYKLRPILRKDETLKIITKQIIINGNIQIIKFINETLNVKNIWYLYENIIIENERWDIIEYFIDKGIGVTNMLLKEILNKGDQDLIKKTLKYHQFKLFIFESEHMSKYIDELTTRRSFSKCFIVQHINEKHEHAIEWMINNGKESYVDNRDLDILTLKINRLDLFIKYVTNMKYVNDECCKYMVINNCFDAMKKCIEHNVIMSNVINYIVSDHNKYKKLIKLGYILNTNDMKIITNHDNLLLWTVNNSNRKRNGTLYMTKDNKRLGNILSELTLWSLHKMYYYRKEKITDYQYIQMVECYQDTSFTDYKPDIQTVNVAINNKCMIALIHLIIDKNLMYDNIVYDMMKYRMWEHVSRAIELGWPLNKSQEHQAYNLFLNYLNCKNYDEDECDYYIKYKKSLKKRTYHT